MRCIWQRQKEISPFYKAEQVAIRYMHVLKINNNWFSGQRTWRRRLPHKFILNPLVIGVAIGVF